ncbi:contractile injection system tape measure protein [Mycetohabitans rhizoxinica]|uniref:contractile injection system tape measure protein n=1 Tax=Mycetohabitans rhizoxinica TaxID=412963 RepID=UPI0030D4F9ED
MGKTPTWRPTRGCCGCCARCRPRYPLAQQRPGLRHRSRRQSPRGWQRLSITDVRTLFLQRAGVLRYERSTWQLELARDASDWLLMQWPWQHLRVTLSGVVTADDNICIRETYSAGHQARRRS